MVPLVGAGPEDPRRQLRGRARHHAAAAARQAGARRRDAGRRAAHRRLDAAPVPRRAGDGRAAAADHRVDVRGRADGRRRRARQRRRGPLLSGHLCLPQGRRRPRRAQARAPCDAAPARRGLGAARARHAAEERRRGAGAGLDRREGDRRRRRPRPRRRGARQPAARRHAAAGRPDGDLRPRRGLRRQPAQARPAAGHAVQHLYADRPAADADRHAGQGVAAGRGAARSRPEGALFRRPRRRQQRVQRDARRPSARGRPLPARRGGRARRRAAASGASTR